MSVVADRLRDPLTPIEVATFDGFDAGTASTRGAREPHRHGYHELLWTSAGKVEHSLDGRSVLAPPGTITVIGRGQVHVLERAVGFAGAAVRFTDEAMLGGSRADPSGAWLLAGRVERVIEVPAGDIPALEATIATLTAELNRPVDRCSADLQRHLLSTILLWIERWYDASQIERPASDAPAVSLHRRFVALLEHGFRRHHDAGYYADALGVPPAALSRALAGVTGSGTKELITERAMLEAVRLLRFTDDAISQVAHQAGYEDPLYFSRAFKRRHGEPPMAYRARTRGA